MWQMWRGLIVLLAVTTACMQFPALDDSVPASAQRADYPDLVPLGPLLAGAAAVQGRNADTERTMARRVAALRSRAASLQGPVLDSGTRTRMRRGVAPI